MILLTSTTAIATATATIIVIIIITMTMTGNLLSNIVVAMRALSGTTA